MLINTCSCFSIVKWPVTHSTGNWVNCQKQDARVPAVLTAVSNKNIVTYSYFYHIQLLHGLYIQQQTLKCIEWIIICNTVLHSYFHHFLLLHILYIKLLFLEFLTLIFTIIISYIHNSIILCYYISIIYSKILKNFNSIINCNIVLFHISRMIFYCISCI